MSQPWQLIAHPDEDLCDIGSIAIRKALERMNVLASVVAVYNVDDANGRIERHDETELDLVVISSTTPPDAATSVGLSGREAMMKFVRALKVRRPAVPVIVVASTPDDRLAGFLEAFDATGIVTIGNDFGATLIERIRALYSVPMPSVAERLHDEERKAAARERGLLQLDIHLGGDHGGQWRMRGSGTVEFEANGMLQLDRKLLSSLVRRSKRLNEWGGGPDDLGEWIAELDDVSSDLRQLLFRNATDNMDCWDRFVKMREQIGGIAKSRIRITVNDDTHAVLVEALRDSDVKVDESWVLKAPVFRRYEQPMNYAPLFVDVASRKGPISCLIVEADGEPGSVPVGKGEVQRFERLANLAVEADAVERILRASSDRHVERLSLGDVDGDPAEVVLAKLAERQWHVVHFCGHVGGDATDAALILRASDERVLTVTRLSKALHRTQLLFLNSCRSADTQIVMHAVEQSVSAVLGFQWKIEDQAALEFATDFYQALFNPPAGKERSLEYALMHARKKAYQRRPQHPSWIAPVLVMQMA